jgi:phage terminase large subunit
VIHRRFGKTVFAINKLIRNVLTCKRRAARAHYFAPTYRQAKSIAWDYLQYFTMHIPGMEYNRTELSAQFPYGQRIQLVGANNPDAFRGQYSDSALLDEVAMMPPRLWSEIVRPALADREGEACFIGTPAGRNGFYDLYERAGTLAGWGRCLLGYKDTGIIPESEIQLLRQEMADYEFAQEMECSFNAAVRGAYYGKVLAEAEAAGRITSVPYDEALPVYTSWDLGMRDATAIWFIQVSPGGEIRLIDYQEYHATGLPDIIRDLRSKPYRYERHIAPHDIRVRELGSGTSRFEVCASNGVLFDVCRNMPLMDGIEATRTMLHKTWIDATKCKIGLNHLQLYRADFDEKTGVPSIRPLHDHTSHAADSLRMFAVEMGQRQGSHWGAQINYDLLDRLTM